jgi:hypothetical protein
MGNDNPVKGLWWLLEVQENNHPVYFSGQETWKTLSPYIALKFSSRELAETFIVGLVDKQNVWQPVEHEFL